MPHVSEGRMWTNLDEVRVLKECKHSNIVKYYHSYEIRDEIWV